MEIQNKETITEEPNMKGRVIARLRREFERIQKKIVNLESEREDYKYKIKAVLEEISWIEENIGGIKIK